MPAIAGLYWSQAITAQFSYFPAPDKTAWLSPTVSFAEPVDEVEVAVLRWPSKRLLLRGEVLQLFLDVPDVSAAQDSNLSTLHFAATDGLR